MFDITLHPLPGTNEVGADVMVGRHCLRSLNMHRTYTVVQNCSLILLCCLLFSFLQGGVSCFLLLVMITGFTGQI
jgi:hypothetical protein